MVLGPAVATCAGGLVAVVLFICAFVVLKQVGNGALQLTLAAAVYVFVGSVFLGADVVAMMGSRRQWMTRLMATCQLQQYQRDMNWPFDATCRVCLWAYLARARLEPRAPTRVYPDGRCDCDQVSSRDPCVHRRQARPAKPQPVVKSPRAARTDDTGGPISSWLAGTSPPEATPSSPHVAPQNGAVPVRLNVAPPPLLVVDTPASVEVDSREFPSTDDAHWQYPSRETGTGEDWSIGTASFVFNPADFVISGDTIGDTIFEDTTEPTSYLDRWCQGYGRVLSWVGESVGVLGNADREEAGPKSPTVQGRETSSVDGQDGKHFSVRDSGKGRGSTTNEPALGPHIEGNELHLTSLAPDDFDCEANDENDSGWGSDSSGDYETIFMGLEEGTTGMLVAQGDVWRPPDVGSYTLPKKLQTCPADFTFDDSVSYFEPLSAGWRARSLSPIYEEPEDAPSRSVTIQGSIRGSSTEQSTLPEAAMPSTTNLQGRGSCSVSTFKSTVGCSDASSGGSDAEHIAETIFTWPSQELSLRQLPGNSEDFWLDDSSKSSCRILQGGIRSRLQCAAETVDNCSFEEQLQDYGEGSCSSTCSLSSMDEVDLYPQDTDCSKKLESPTWVDNCLFDSVGKQGHKLR